MKRNAVLGNLSWNIWGHIITGNDVVADPMKVQDTVQWLAPTDLKALRGFLGLIGYYRRFVEGYYKIAWPLTQLLKKGSFYWSMEAQMAFDCLKRAMTELLFQQYLVLARNL